MSSIIKKYISQDNNINFEVIYNIDNTSDTMLSFEGSWHTHGDLLSVDNQTPEEATDIFVVDLLSDKILIMVSYIDDKKEVSITDDPESELKYKQENEILEFRFWSGNKIYKNQEILTSNVQWKDFP